jgi:hypothetical protein
MSRLERRSGSQQNSILEGRFIRTVLREEGDDILKAQSKKMRASGFKSQELFSSRTMSPSDSILTYEHLKRHRFIDMKRRKTKDGSINKKNYAIHNRILYGHANNVVRRLSFGFTEETKAIMRSMVDER